MRKGGHKASAGQKLLFEECAKVSKTKRANNHPNMIEAGIPKLIKKVTPKNRARKSKKVILKNESNTDKSRSGELMGGCVLAQNLTPKEERTKRPIKINIRGTSANSCREKMMAKLHSHRRGTLDWWKCYLDSCASYLPHIFCPRVPQEHRRKRDHDG